MSERRIEWGVLRECVLCGKATIHPHGDYLAVRLEVQGGEFTTPYRSPTAPVGHQDCAPHAIRERTLYVDDPIMERAIVKDVQV